MTADGEPHETANPVPGAADAGWAAWQASQFLHGGHDAEERAYRGGFDDGWVAAVAYLREQP